MDTWTVFAGLLIPASVAGFWIGAADKVGCAMLRAILVGAFEGAAYTGLVKESVSQSDAISHTIVLMFISFYLYFFFATIASVPSQILTQNEEKWKIVIARQAFFHKILRISLGFEELKGVSTATGLTVIAVKFVLFPTLGWALWKFFAIPSPSLAFLKHLGIPT